MTTRGPAPLIGVIRVLTTTDPELLDAHGRVLEHRFGFRTISVCIPDQPDGIHDDASHLAAEPKIVELARYLVSDEGVDALLISCAADPALEQTRMAVDVPVVGAGSCAAALALASGRRVGVLDLTPDTPASVVDVLGAHLQVAVQPRGVETTNDLRTATGYDACIEGAREVVGDGVDVIMQACTGMTTIGLAPRLQADLGVPVIDAVVAAGSILFHRLVAGVAAS